MTTYRWTENGYVAKDTGAPMELPDRAEIEAPMVMNDIPEYNSPITGELITSRPQRLEDLKKNNCIDAGDFQRKPRGFKNPTYTKKRGLKTNPELTGKDPE